MNNQDHSYTRKFTKVELATHTYNVVLQRIIDFKLDVDFYKARAKQHKKDSNEYNGFIAKAAESQTFLNNNELTLKVLEQQLQHYEVDEKKKK